MVLVLHKPWAGMKMAGSNHGLGFSACLAVRFGAGEAVSNKALVPPASDLGVAFVFGWSGGGKDVGRITDSRRSRTLC